MGTEYTIISRLIFERLLVLICIIHIYDYLMSFIYLGFLLILSQLKQIFMIMMQFICRQCMYRSYQQEIKSKTQIVERKRAFLA